MIVVWVVLILHLTRRVKKRSHFIEQEIIVKRTLVSWCLGSVKLILFKIGIGVNIQCVVDSSISYRGRILVGVILNWWVVESRILRVLNLVEVLRLRLLKKPLSETLLPLVGLILLLSRKHILDIITPLLDLSSFLRMLYWLLLCLVLQTRSKIFLDPIIKP